MHSSSNIDTIPIRVVRIVSYAGRRHRVHIVLIVVVASFCDAHNAAGTLSIAYVAKKINASLQIQAEIDEFPFYSFTLVFFLFKYEHVMVEKLLQTFVDKIDPQLFK
ncbi:hypothetical protein T01_5265 [Trichinella spiralis]|uniref:Uncharacterized protein n=1 Tax=Trichinella spiralis TaxID=6334 RepID=A0A0V1B507_TRISP|nr:hypothetical protein T01_5265 [Trichinella spiralis]